ncbi:CYTH and CHAD domain-containing protein [soil metagenome]
MSLEREAKLRVDAGFHMPDLSRPDDGWRAETDHAAERSVSTYHDTDDLRLARWGASLRYRTTDGWTVKLPHSTDGAVTARQERTFEGSAGRPPSDAVDLVRAIVRGAAMGPVVRLQTVRHRTRIVGVTDGQPLAELVEDEVSVLDGRRIVERFREVEFELDREADASAIGPIVERLVDAGAQAASPVPKVVRALGGRAAKPADVVVPAIGPSSTVADVISWAVAASTERLVAHDPSVRLGVDDEGVHQARVATRRLRSDLRTFRSLLDGEWRDGLREELRWLGSELGAVRDLDVLGERLRVQAPSLPDDDAPSTSSLLGRLRDARETARTELLSTMRGPRYVALLDALVDAAAHPRVLEEVADARADDVLGVVMDAPWAHLRKVCDGLGAGSTDEELHEARIRAKRVRYAAEVLTPVFGKPARRFTRTAESLQQVLGNHQDAVMAIAWLRQASKGAAPDIAFTAGRLAGIDASLRDEARAEWPDVWAELRRRRLRFWE